ncbi:TPA: sigma-70 region 4 domain-containing protein [Citrobacter freundii]|nr:sigma factor-like helix-turn-helix DNA-binding protein [Citrobacter freundii]HBH6881794.1 sigma-70 region 4 domain-containing protein [Citrobacter freundii]HBH6984927.1 sigma-70 region 4 domain-containing protein [Citrobacter freundii]HBN0078421.1 sigma-70 region 4 domain-containing protein [Enterobacter chengduensis]
MDTTVDRNTPYTSRPWIFTALSLRFNEAMTYREIAEQLNISTSATHKMFTRFRRTGITAKALSYLLKQWDALNLYCGNGWGKY